MISAMPGNLILAIDTCTSACSIAVGDGATLLGEHSWRTDRHHTADVSRRIQQMFADAGRAASETACIAVALGPGSFTGVRCGLALAKGMAAAGEAKLIGMSAFDILHATQPGSPSTGQPLIAVLEAGRKRVAVQKFPSKNGAFELITHDVFAQYVPSPSYVCGDIPSGFQPRDMLQQRAPSWLNLRRAGVLLALAAERHALGQWHDPVSLGPIYPP